jgi:uncharacterized protein
MVATGHGSVGGRGKGYRLSLAGRVYTTPLARTGLVSRSAGRYIPATGVLGMRRRLVNGRCNMPSVELDLPEVCSVILLENAGSIAVARRLGFRPTRSAQAGSVTGRATPSRRKRPLHNSAAPISEESGLLPRIVWVLDGGPSGHPPGGLYRWQDWPVVSWSTRTRFRAGVAVGSVVVEKGNELHIDPYIVLGAAVVGFLVGMTGAGGGALMTPMLILIFGVKPSTAISSDLVAAVVMRPFGAAVHLRKGTVNLGLVAWMVLGSVPMAFLGAYLLHLMGQSESAQTNIEKALGTALLVGAAAMILRFYLDRRKGQLRQGVVHGVAVRPVLTVVIGMIGGLIVGMTSVGSGSLMIVLLLFAYPVLGASQLVGTDLTQAVPLTIAAALGALAFGHVAIPVTASLVIGSVPAVLVGSFISSRAPDRYVRPVITFVIFASGLKYVGLDTTALGWVLCAILLAAAVVWLFYARPWEKGAPLGLSAAEEEA